LAAAGVDELPGRGLSRSTSTDADLDVGDAAPDPGPPDVVANAHCPSGVTATPNGLPPVLTGVVPAGPSRGPAAVALEHAGEASARPGSGEAATPEPEGGAGTEEAGVPPDVHPALAPSVTAATRQPTAMCRF
jgi:hypothetical protein